MARQVGHILYEGTLGGVRHYRIKGRDGWFASMKGGPSRDMIMHSSNFQRTRENISEFAGVSRAAKSFRAGIGSLRRRFQDSSFNNRVTRAVHNLMRRDSTGSRGQRKVSFSSFGRLMTGIEWNSTRSLQSVLNGSHSVQFTSDGLGAQARFTCSASRLFNAPKGATHARLVLLVHTASDYAYKSDFKTFAAVNRSAEGRHSESWSDYLDVSQTLDSDLVLEASLGSLNLDSSAVFISVGVEFYQLVGDFYYTMREGGSMRTEAAFSVSMCSSSELRSLPQDEIVNSDGLVTDRASAFYGRVRFKRTGIS